jgi:hypothetical protein
MSSLGRYEKCKRCGDYGFSHTHKCPPKFIYVRIDDDMKPEGDWVVDDQIWAHSFVHAKDAADAAERVVSNDPEFYEITVHRILVIPYGDEDEDDDGNMVLPSGKYQIFDVTYEAVPEFTATAV